MISGSARFNRRQHPKSFMILYIRIESALYIVNRFLCLLVVSRWLIVGRNSSDWLLAIAD